jgi:hypothetical protein
MAQCWTPTALDDLSYQGCAGRAASHYSFVPACGPRRRLRYQRARHNIFIASTFRRGFGRAFLVAAQSSMRLLTTAAFLLSLGVHGFGRSRLRRIDPTPPIPPLPIGSLQNETAST